VRHILGSAPHRAVPCVPSDVGVRNELIAPYAPSDGAVLFVIKTDSISLIGPSLVRAGGRVQFRVGVHAELRALVHIMNRAVAEIPTRRDDRANKCSRAQA
jgi:hypothetical protein